MYKEFFTQKHNVKLAGEVTDAGSRGNSGTVYANQPVRYGGVLAAPAQKEMVFLSSVYETKLPEGNGQYFARYRAILDDAESAPLNSGEAVTTPLTNYAGNFMDGLWITPMPEHKSMNIGYVADHRNIDDISEDQAEQVSYMFADMVDLYIAAAITDAAEMSNTARGAQVLYAGSKTADAALVAADVISLGLVNEAETVLSQKNGFYWNAGVLAKSAIAKNPWKNNEEDPYVLVIGKQQKKAFRDLDEFFSAERYGGNEVRLSGEIGKTIFGTRIVVSDNIQEKAKGSANWDTTEANGAVAVNTAVDVARCLLMKGTAAYVFVWGKEPEFEVLKVPGYLRKELRVWGMYAGSILHADAIVKIDVATNVPLN